jgi:Ni,Fe-hydrogenase III small subunit
MEELVLVQRVVMKMWDAMPEPTVIIHLHNMLVKKGILEREVGLYAELQNYRDFSSTHSFLMASPTFTFLWY